MDIDPRAVQIAAAALMLKAKVMSSEAQPKQLNLVASQPRLGSFRDDDPAIIELVRKVKLETGIEEDLTKTIISSLKGADHLGTLLKINTQIDELISKEAKSNLRQTVEEQLVLLGDQPVVENRR